MRSSHAWTSSTVVKDDLPNWILHHRRQKQRLLVLTPCWPLLVATVRSWTSHQTPGSMRTWLRRPANPNYFKVFSASAHSGEPRLGKHAADLDGEVPSRNSASTPTDLASSARQRPWSRNLASSRVKSQLTLVRCRATFLQLPSHTRVCMLRPPKKHTTSFSLDA